MTPATWPARERIPRSFNDALAHGWRIRRVVSRDDEGIEVRIGKNLGSLRLRLTVPFQLVNRYGRPRDPRVARARR